MVNLGHSVALLHEYPSDGRVERIDSSQPDLPVWCSQASGIRDAVASADAWRPDVVYLQGLESLELEAELLERYRTVYYAHNYDGTCVSGRKCHLLPQPRPCHRTMGLACLLLYYPRRCGGLHPGTMLRMFQQQSLRRDRLPRFQAILVASRHMYREFQRHGVSSSQLNLVPLPSPDQDASRIPPQEKAPGHRILFSGRLTDIKGGAHLVRAVSEAGRKLGRPLTLVIAGDGPEKESLRNLAGRLGVIAEFTGWVDREQMLNLVRDASLLAVPSVWPEPFGLVGVEAGGLGVPAVGYAVGGVTDWLIAGESGELAPGDPPTVEGLAAAIVRALADARHYNRLCAGAWKNAARFRLHQHLARLEPILVSSGAVTVSEGPIESARI